MKAAIATLLCPLFLLACNDPGNLHQAALDGDLDAVKRLVADGIDVDSRDDLGSTPLHYAANKYHIEVMMFLLENGADANAQQNGGMTALHHAVVANGPEVAQLLLKYGADPNIRLENGHTALNIAEMMGRTATAELLKNNNAELGEHEAIVIEPGTKQTPPADAKYKMVIYSPTGKAIQEMIQYGTEVIDTPHGGTTLVTSPSTRISPSLQKLPSGFKAEIIELNSGQILFSKEY